ncbi:aspartate aminotransferase family protein [Halovenus marina]|uniref:aspartate aminotransferase family protein n=1 Tax=Halovenus marina TaxID=3396621 RepID=UPI003F55FC19
MTYERYGQQPLDAYARSLELQENAIEEIPEAASSNYRGKTSYAPYPMIYMEEGEGVTITDVDGNEYIDFHCGVSSIINGHNPEQQLSVVREQLDRGAYFATTYELEAETASLVNDLVPGSDRTKFISTGTEAVMTAMRLARAYTGKDKILKFEGMYHGHTDYALMNYHPPTEALGTRRNPNTIPDANGIPRKTLETVESIPWNDIDLLEEKLDREGDEIAAVITEATLSNSGLLWPEDDYLDRLRELTREHDVLFILDEVVTGFRIALGGAQEYFDIEPDLAIYGKSLANGYPCAAVTGREEVMEFIGTGSDEATFMGTFSGHPMAVAATKGNLELLADRDDDAYERLRARGETLVSGLRDILADAGYNALVPDFAGFTYVHFCDEDSNPEEWTEWRDVDGNIDIEMYERFASEVIGEGVFFPPKFGRINLTHEHTDEHIEAALEASKTAAQRL